PGRCSLCEWRAAQNPAYRLARLSTACREVWLGGLFCETMRRLSTEGSLLRNIFVVATILLSAAAGFGQNPPSLPASFRAATIHSPECAEIFVRSGGKGPVVVLVHGNAENSDSWGPLAADLMKDHTVVAPDLRGIGRSSKPETGYDKKKRKPRTSGRS